jgi:hypothetical protein
VDKYIKLVKYMYTLISKQYGMIIGQLNDLFHSMKYNFIPGERYDKVCQIIQMS